VQNALQPQAETDALPLHWDG